MSPVIEVRQLHKRYGGTVAVDDISFAAAATPGVLPDGAAAADHGRLGGGVRTGCSQILPLGVDFNVEAADDQSDAAAARPRPAGRA